MFYPVCLAGGAAPEELQSELDVVMLHDCEVGAPAHYWTDHAAVVKDASGEAETDSTIVRWIGEIEGDGSRLYNPSGRSATLGDGPSRECEAHGRFLLEQAHSLSSITLDDLVGDAYGLDDVHTWALDITPDAPAPSPVPLSPKPPNSTRLTSSQVRPA